MTSDQTEVARWSFGYEWNGQFYRRTTEPMTHAAAVAQLEADRPGAEIVSVYKA